MPDRHGELGDVPAVDLTGGGRDQLGDRPRRVTGLAASLLDLPIGSACLGISPCDIRRGRLEFFALRPIGLKRPGFATGRVLPRAVAQRS